MILGFLLFIVIIITMSIKIVPHQSVYIIERFGRYNRLVSSGLHFIVPFVDKIAYVHTLKEQCFYIEEQKAITKDNVVLEIDSVLYVIVRDPIMASYGSSDPHMAISQLVQTTMRSAIGKIDLDSTFEERERLNYEVVSAISSATKNWGVECLRYEIRDIHPPKQILEAMQMQVAADRKKRAKVLESEAERDYLINVAEGKRQERILESEGHMIQKMNAAKGEAEYIKQIAMSSSEAIERIASAFTTKHAEEAANLKIAEQYIEAFRNLAKTTNTVILPSNISNPSAAVTEAMTIFSTLNKKS